MADTRILTNAGEIRCLEKIAELPRKIALFTNNATVAATNVLADFTKPVYSGYADIDLDSWPTPTTAGGGEAQATHPEVDFAYTGLGADVTVRGWFTFDSTDNTILEVNKYETGKTLNAGAGSHLITVSLQASDDNA